MQAAVIQSERVAVQKVSKPQYSNDEILVRVHATTVTRGDIVLKSLPRLMFWTPVRKLLGVPPKKTIPGHEFAGIVEAVGGDVTGYKVGDEVFGTTTGLSAGANAEYVSVPQKSETAVLAHKPRTLSFEDAAVLPVGAMTALYLLRAADAQAGQHALIYGASGSVGSYAVQIAKALGMTTTAVCSTRNIETVRSLGADRMIDYASDDFSAREATYDVIFDAVGKTTKDQRQRALKPDGRFTSIRTNTHESDEAFAQIIDWAAAGQLTPLIDRCAALSEIATVYKYVASGRKRGNVVIQVHPTGA